MRLSKLIKELEKAMQENGDIKVAVFDEKLNGYRFVSNIRLQDSTSYADDGFIVIVKGKIW